MAQLEKTKSGLEPDMSEIPFRITTKNVEEHLQKAINLMVRDLREKGVNARDVRITVMTDNISKQFRPFIIALPMDGAVKGRSTNSENLSIYQNEENENNIQLHDWLFKFLSAFSFGKSDVKAFDSVTFRKELNISPVRANDLKRLARPKVHSVRDDRKPTHVVMYIDPLRVFKNMLKTSEDDKFKVLIKKDNSRDLNAGECEYKVFKIYESRKPKSDEREKLTKLLKSNINNKRS